MDATAQAVANNTTDSLDSLFMVGTVTAIAGKTLTVTANGASLALPHLAAYYPTVGDVVQILCPRGRPFVVGTTGPSGVVCTAKLSANATITANTDVFAQGGWTATTDTDGIFAVGGVAGHTYSTMTLPYAGRYEIDLTGLYTGITSGTVACHITKNASTAVLTNGVASDTRAAVSAGEGTRVHARRSTLFNAGDVLYWAYWCSSTSTLSGLSTSIPIEMTVRYQGSR